MPAQGNALGADATEIFEALKGRDFYDRSSFRPFRALSFLTFANPGRCPGLSYGCPFGAEPQQDKVTTPACGTDS